MATRAITLSHHGRYEVAIEVVQSSASRSGKMLFTFSITYLQQAGLFEQTLSYLSQPARSSILKDHFAR